MNELQLDVIQQYNIAVLQHQSPIDRRQQDVIENLLNFTTNLW
jgi:hypothetical protein